MVQLSNLFIFLGVVSIFVGIVVIVIIYSSQKKKPDDPGSYENQEEDKKIVNDDIKAGYFFSYYPGEWTKKEVEKKCKYRMARLAHYIQLIKEGIISDSDVPCKWSWMLYGDKNPQPIVYDLTGKCKLPQVGINFGVGVEKAGLMCITKEKDTNAKFSVPLCLLEHKKCTGGSEMDESNGCKCVIKPGSKPKPPTCDSKKGYILAKDKKSCICKPGTKYDKTKDMCVQLNDHLNLYYPSKSPYTTGFTASSARKYCEQKGGKMADLTTVAGMARAGKLKEGCVWSWLDESPGHPIYVLLNPTSKFVKGCGGSPGIHINPKTNFSKRGGVWCIGPYDTKDAKLSVQL